MEKKGPETRPRKGERTRHLSVPFQTLNERDQSQMENNKGAVLVHLSSYKKC